MEGNGFTIITVEGLFRGFVMNMYDLTCRGVTKIVTFLEDASRSIDIFQTGDFLVVRLHAPERPSDRTIGIVAER